MKGGGHPVNLNWKEPFVKPDEEGLFCLKRFAQFLNNDSFLPGKSCAITPKSWLVTPVIFHSKNSLLACYFCTKTMHFQSNIFKNLVINLREKTEIWYYIIWTDWIFVEYLIVISHDFPGRKESSTKNCANILKQKSHSSSGFAKFFHRIKGLLSDKGRWQTNQIGN